MSQPDTFEIGYALAQKKQRSFVQPSLLAHAKSKNINLVCIDLGRPLVEQGPFDAILHKVSGEDWNKQLTSYEKKHPGVIVVDPPKAIERLHNRISMLQAVAELQAGDQQVSEEQETFGIPKQHVVDSIEGLADLETLDLKFPVIAKPLVADGSAKSHAMSLIFNADGLTKLKPPVVLQQFVNHGGVIFKVYVVGEYVKCVRRKSLPDVNEDELKRSEGPLSFSQISNMASSGEVGDSVDANMAELPPAKFISDLAGGLREALGLRLFNFDVIRDTKVGNHYHVIDINYFPGYAKMPSYETVLTDFFLSLAHRKEALVGRETLAAVAN